VAADEPVPLATFAQLNTGAFADLVRDYDPQAQEDLMIEATRMCESEADRRLVPFTLTESHRAEGVDPDEYADVANLPMDLQGTIGSSYANALGSTTSLVRHCWLNEYGSRYPEFWAYTDVAVQIVRSYGGSENFTVSQLIGPEPDSGHLWFQLGTFLPVASIIRVTYSAGYTTIPANLARACKYMAASIAVRELDPGSSAHDPDLLYNNALNVLKPYLRT
jgi:hypothetical protein